MAFKVLCHRILKLLGFLINNEVSFPFDFYLKAVEVVVAELQLSLLKSNDILPPSRYPPHITHFHLLNVISIGKINSVFDFAG